MKHHERTVKALKKIPINSVIRMASERHMHRCIGEALLDAGIAFAHEQDLDEAGRIDFHTADYVGIEAKSMPTNARLVVEQVKRYAEHRAVHSLILITVHSVNHPFPSEINGKPFTLINLSQLAGPSI